MRNPISYKFNPLADNALEALQEIVDDYMAEDFSSWQWTQNQGRLKDGPEKTLKWMLESCSKSQCQDYYVSLSHFNGTVFPSGSNAPQSEDVRELSLYTPIAQAQSDVRIAPFALDIEEEEEAEPIRLQLVSS